MKAFSPTAYWVISSWTRQRKITFNSRDYFLLWENGKCRILDSSLKLKFDR